MSVLNIDFILYFFFLFLIWNYGLSGGLVGKESACNAGDTGSIPGLGRSPGGWHDNPLWYSCLENPMDRGAWRIMGHRVAKSQTQLKRVSMHACTPLELKKHKKQP